MGLFKFQNYSAIKNAQDNPRVVATVETKNGNVFGIVDTPNVAGTGTAETQAPFADATAAQGEVWVMYNRVDKPEIRNYADYSVKEGEYIRAIKLNNLSGEIAEMSGDLVVEGKDATETPINIEVGAKLVPNCIS